MKIYSRSLDTWEQKCLGLLQEAVDSLSYSIKWEERMCVAAQLIGLQADKRENRGESVDEVNLVHFLRNYAVDRYTVSLAFIEPNVEVPPVEKYEDYFVEYDEFLTQKLKKLINITNAMYAAGMFCIADKIKKKAICVDQQILCNNRELLEGIQADWSAHHMTRKHTTAENKHDTYEKWEKENGYHYD